MAAFALGPAATAAGYRLLGFDSVGSTNAEARARGRAGERGPLWLVARTQTAGRGRRGRVWHSPEGNLAASLLWTIDGTPADAATLGFVAGLALARALDAVVPAVSIALKWPNDVLADGAKLAGILVEAEEGGAGDIAAVVGIGVNVVAAPEGLPYPATSLAALGAALTAEALFFEFAEAWVPLAREWQAGGFAALRTAWLARAGGLGTETAVQSGGAILRGVFETVDAAGRLILRDAAGARHAVAAGEVHFGAAATASAG